VEEAQFGTLIAAKELVKVIVSEQSDIRMLWAITPPEAEPRM
jgi:hypothetical protein